MKQFNLEEYLQNPNKKVVTRCGLNVRIICTDRKSCDDVEFPIVCLAEKNNQEVFFTTQKDGRFKVDGSTYEYDLFFAPTKHEGWVNMYREDDGSLIFSKATYRTKKDALNVAFPKEYYISTIKIEWEE